MGNPSAIRHEDVTVFREGVLPGDGAQQFAATCLAEMTHLPTGVASGRSEAVTVPAGMELAEAPAEPAPLLLHVVAGNVAILWGDEPRRTALAGPGETVMVPPGVAFRARNASPVAVLQFICVRSG